MTNFNTRNVENMSLMFNSCKNLTSLDLSSFNTESVNNLNQMFFSCESLTSLNLSNFNSLNLMFMNLVFDFCYSLNYLDISNLNTEKVINMAKLFYACSSLEYLKINFNTINVWTMEGMFYNCFSLISLDLSSFNTSNVQNMRYMFYNCKKLSVLNISNFDTNSLTNAEHMFYNCYNLEYINFKEYNDINDMSIQYILWGIRENIVVGINEDNNITKFKEEIELKLCHMITCEYNWKAYQKKIIADTMICVDNCDGYIYEKNQICYSTCPEGEDFCQPQYTESIIKTTGINQEKENIISTGIYYNKDPVLSEIIPSTKGIIFDKSTDKNYLTETILNIYKYNITTETDEDIYYNIIEEILINYPLNELNDDVGLIIEGKGDFMFQITNTEKEKLILNGKNKSKNELSIIELDECENILKDYYHIDRNKYLIIIKYEKITNISLDRLIQYEVYEPLNKTKLNLSICDNKPINIYTPLKLSEELNNLYHELKMKGYDLFNINSSFYQDICTPFKSPNGTDVLLSDRINYYYNNNETICQSNCQFSDYLFEEKLLKCKCDFNNSETKTKEIKKFNKKTLYQNFYYTLKFFNYKVLKCYKLAFRINSVTINKGSIIAIIFFSFFLLSFIIFCFKGINNLKIEFIKRISLDEKKSNENIIKEDNNKIITNTEQINRLNNKSSTNRTIKIKKHSTEDIKLGSPPKKNIVTKRKSATQLKKNLEIYSNNLNGKNLLMLNKINNLNKIQEQIEEKEIKENNILNNEIKEDNNEEKLDDFELNNLEFNEAIKLDKRTFISIYWSIIKREHLIYLHSS